MNTNTARRIAASPNAYTRDELIEALEVLDAEHERTNISTYRNLLLDAHGRLRRALMAGNHK